MTESQSVKTYVLTCEDGIERRGDAKKLIKYLTDTDDGVRDMHLVKKTTVFWKVGLSKDAIRV